MKVDRKSPTLSPKTVIKPKESNDLDLLRGLLATTSTTQKTTTILHEHKIEIGILTTETTTIETSDEAVDSDLYSDEEFYSDYENTNDTSSSSSTIKSLLLTLAFLWCL